MRIFAIGNKQIRPSGRKTPGSAGFQPAHRVATAVVIVLSALVSVSAFATNVTGTWNFLVDLGAGGQGSPVFTLKQSGQQISGTYEGPLGKHNITGRVTGNTIVIKLQVTRDDGPMSLTYSGKIESATSMGGSVNVMRGTQGMRGTWRANKRQ
jgi:hypothetical protein